MANREYSVNDVWSRQHRVAVITIRSSRHYLTIASETAKFYYPHLPSHGEHLEPRGSANPRRSLPTGQTACSLTLESFGRYVPEESDPRRGRQLVQPVPIPYAPRGSLETNV